MNSEPNARCYFRLPKELCLLPFFTRKEMVEWHILQLNKARNSLPSLSISCFPIKTRSLCLHT